MSSSIVYTTSVCPYCQSAKRLLTEKNISFEEVSLDDQPDLRAELSEKFGGWRTVPMIVLDGEFVGGYTELVQHYKQQDAQA